MPDTSQKTEVTERIADPVADNPNPEIVSEPSPAPQPAPADGEPVAEPAPVNPRAARMKAIADRVRAKRESENAPEFTGDFSDPAQVAGNVARKDDPAAEPAAAAAPEPAPRPAPTADKPTRLKLKVDGQEFERDLGEVARLADMTIEEAEANPERATRYAQKELAASRRLDQAKEILRGVNERTPQDGRAPGRAPHQEPRRTDDPEGIPEPSTARPDQGDDEFAELVEEIQFGGDPKETARKLQTAITRTAEGISKKTTNEQKVSDHIAFSQAALGRFKSANKDLADDPVAEAAMTELLYRNYHDDLVALGVPEDLVPKSRSALADAHLIARLQGHPVRPIEKLLDDTKSKYLNWRGPAGQQQQPNPSPAPRPSQPRVNLDRTERRQAIPTQPTRASAPLSDPAAAKPQQRTRSDTIMQMRKARGQVTA